MPNIFDPDQAAFPVTHPSILPGMSLRTYATIEAMKAILSDSEFANEMGEDAISKMAISQADNLMHYLEEEAEELARPEEE